MGESEQDCLGITGGNTSYYSSNEATMPYGMEFLLCPPDSRDTNRQLNTTDVRTRIDTQIVNTGTILRYQISASQAFTIPNVAQSANTTDANQTANLLISTFTHYVVKGYLNFYLHDATTGEYQFLDQLSYDFLTTTNRFGLDKSVIVYFYATGDLACAGFSTHISASNTLRSELVPLTPLPDEDPAPGPIDGTSNNTDPGIGDNPDSPGPSNPSENTTEPIDPLVLPPPEDPNQRDDNGGYTNQTINENIDNYETYSDLTKYSILCMVLTLLIGILIFLIVHLVITLLKM